MTSQAGSFVADFHNSKALVACFGLGKGGSGSVLYSRLVIREHNSPLTSQRIVGVHYAGIAAKDFNDLGHREVLEWGYVRGVCGVGEGEGLALVRLNDTRPHSRPLSLECVW